VTLLLPGVDVSRHLLGVTYVGAGATTGYGISGTAVATLIGTAVATLTLVLLILQNNRKTRREVAKDLTDAYENGKADKAAELQPWLNYWMGLATGSIHLPAPSAAPETPPTPLPTPLPPLPKHEEEVDDE
jgi:hypothetical protein